MQSSQLTGRTVIIKGEAFVNFSTTSYLNLSNHKEFIDFTLRGIKNYGVSYGSSPLTEPKLSIYEELESVLANYYGSESALLFSSGFMSSRALVMYFSNTGYKIQYPFLSHPAIQIKQQGVFSMEIDALDMVNPINPTIYKPIKPNSIIDASHGFGIIDDQIRNLIQKGHHICGSLNKAFACPSGIVFCSKELKNQLQSSPFYSTASAPAPSTCYALLMAMESGLINRQQERLTALLKLIPESKAYYFHKHLPILTFKDTSLEFYEKVLHQKLLIWRNKYPKETGKLINRAVIHACLQEKDIHQLMDVI